MLHKFGGFIQGQYYFNNQWYANALYAISKAYNVNRAQFIRGGMGAAFLPVGNMEMAFGDNASSIQQVDLTLWYRPIQAIKFGLQYSYMAVNFLQMTTVPAATANTTRFGNNHRVEFVGYFYF